ncbi:hypothetical protein BDY19DRAFT_991401 [Irpex rosettiformis]|uniref:Uncharacterized protein n=1 Tax=Irpex rosettiformis TaxID=378272 RepID=A0ACB8UC16_9APHY|nr:hypothetical protein BDY19DRAFT_991401 [Irpex rosettiformis]
MMRSLTSSDNTSSRSELHPRTQLPVELIEQILSEAWSLDLRPEKRIDLFTSLSLTSLTFLSIFIRIALTHVHITSASYARHYLLLLRTRSPSESNSDFLLPDNASQTANTLCRTLTFHIDARASCSSDTKPAIKLYSAGDSSTHAISSTLYMLDLMKGSVPNLRKLKLEYTDWGFDDIFDQRRLTPMPPQVEELDIQFRFSPALQNMRLRTKRNSSRQREQGALEIPGFGKGVLEDLRWRFEMTPHPFGRFATPHVKMLRVFGATTSFVAGMLEACQGAHTVVFDEYVELPALPQWIETVVIADTRSKASRAEMCSKDWMVAARSVCGGRENTCTEEMIALLCPVVNQEHERARRRLKSFCATHGVQVKEL